MKKRKSPQKKRAPSIRTITPQLLRWFAAHARDLPWRRTRDPYAIWVSEVMLQQTQVETVTPYYERFMRRLPTVEKLARARLDTVLKLWEGLGYYSRAHNMHRAAKAIVREHHGQLPQTAEALLALPGIGRYTAGAVASIAFGQRVPVVDGNVTRVLCRLFRIRQNPKQTACHEKIWALAESLLPARRAGDYNQALMELGARICTPRNPGCEVCPLSRVCLARHYEEQAVLPLRVRKKPLPFYTVAVAVIYKNGRILIDKRPPEGLLGGLWEFPGGKKHPSETLEAAVRREVREELGIRIRVKNLLAVVDHAYSHFRIRLHAFECVYVSGTPRCLRCADFKWVHPGTLSRYAFPAANTKIIQALDAPKPPLR